MPNLVSDLLKLLVALISVVASHLCFAHADGEDYVFVSFYDQHIEGEFQINFQDLSDKLSIEIPADEAQALTVIQDSASAVQQYISEKFSMSTVDGEKLVLNFTESKVAPETSFAQ